MYLTTEYTAKGYNIKIVNNDEGVTRLIRVKVINYVTNNMDVLDDVCDCGLENTNDCAGNVYIQTNANIRTLLFHSVLSFVHDRVDIFRRAVIHPVNFFAIFKLYKSMCSWSESL